jgi:hypothetical protein
MSARSRNLRIMVVANKTWEAAPLLHALFEKKARPAELAVVERVYDPELFAKRNLERPTPRARLSCPGGDIQVWCIEDWMDPGAGGSNSAEKMRVLPRFFVEAKKGFGGAPDVVIAFGTAGIPTNIPFNGCAVTGTRVFAHDPYAKRPKKDRSIPRPDGKSETMWSDRRLDSVLGSALPKAFFRQAPDMLRHAAEARFLRPPVHPGEPMLVLAGNGFAALSTVNVSDYDDYVWADPASLAAFRARALQNEVGSMETTHGLIRIAAEDALDATPCFLFVSGITDSLGEFDLEVTPRVYAQNYAAGHNAGVLTAWLLPELVRQLSKGV